MDVCSLSNAGNTQFSFNFLARPSAPAQKTRSRSRSPEKQLPKRTPKQTPKADTNGINTRQSVPVLAERNTQASAKQTSAGPSPSYVTPKVTGKRRRGFDEAIENQKAEDDLAGDAPEHISSAERHGLLARRASTVSTSAVGTQAPMPDDIDQLATPDRPEDAQSTVLSIKSTQNSLTSVVPDSQTPLPAVVQRRLPKGLKDSTRSVNEPNKLLSATQNDGGLVLGEDTPRERLRRKRQRSVDSEEIQEESEGIQDELSPEQRTTRNNPSTGKLKRLANFRQNKLSRKYELSPTKVRHSSRTHQESPEQDHDDLSISQQQSPSESEHDISAENLGPAAALASKQERHTKKHSRKSTTALSRVRKQMAHKEQLGIEERGSKRRKLPEGFVKLKVLRLSKPLKRTESNDESGHESSDPLQDPTSYSVSGISGADVLRNTLMETMEKSIKKLVGAAEITDDREQAKEYKRSVGIITKFKEDVMSRIRPIIDRVDAGTRFKHDLKARKKEKARLTAELLEAKKEHDEIIVEMDYIRDEHHKQREAHKRQLKLNEALFDIEFAIQNGKQRAKELGREDEGPELPLEMLISEVSDSVSSRQAGGGLLQQVSEFNKVLEKSATLLEGRV